MAHDLSGYEEVPDRIARAVEKYPDLSLQGEHRIVEVGGKIVIEYVAYAYRNPEDPKPGRGVTWEPYPGTTPYTKNSEVENAETSAWGRAIAALGFEVKRGIASSEEVRNKQSGQGVGPSRTPDPVPAPADKRAILAQLAHEKHIDHAGLEQYASLVGIQPGTRATDAQLDQLIEAVRGHGTDAPLDIEQAAEVSPAAAEPEAGSARPAPAASTVEEAIAKAEKRAKAGAAA